MSTNTGNEAERINSCEGDYQSPVNGRIYRYRVTYQGMTSVAWSASVSWGVNQALWRVGSIPHNALSGPALRELVRAQVVAAIRKAFGEELR